MQTLASQAMEEILEETFGYEEMTVPQLIDRNNLLRKMDEMSRKRVFDDLQ